MLRKYIYLTLFISGIVACTEVDFNKLPPTGQPIVILQADKTYGEAPLTVTFTVTAIPSRGEIEKVIMEFGDGKSAELNFDKQAGKAVTSYTYQAISVFTARASVKDQNGWSSTQIQITTNDAPRISNLELFDHSSRERVTEVVPGTQIILNAQCTDLNSFIANIIVDWGDGTTQQVFTCSGLEHTYKSEGNYTVRLIVFDASMPQPLSSTASTQIVVRRGINQAPNIDVMIISTYSGNAPLPVTLLVGAYDRDGSIVGIKVDWGDGSVETLGSAQLVSERDGRKLYRVSHTYTRAGTYSVTIVAEDDKGKIGTFGSLVNVFSPKPVLAATFSDQLNQNPDGKTYNVVATNSTEQVTITVNLSAYDPDKYDIVYLTEITFPAEGVTYVSILRLGFMQGSNNYVQRVKCKGSGPTEINCTYFTSESFSNGLTAVFRITVFALKTGTVDINIFDQSCVYDPQPNQVNFSPSPDPSLEPCNQIRSRILADESRASSSVSFTVRPQ
ncbi:MAG: PKD domain-containing protein [Candidatus Calescibacterium sp.]|nr:PKD domain-containing protein [Candidatus Calescibacterium sp.]